MNFNFCYRCGTPLKKQADFVYKCLNQHSVFQNSSPAVSLHLVSDDSVIFAVRAKAPGIGLLSGLGGFVDGKENFEEALEREVFEESGLKPEDYKKPIFLCSAYSDYEYEGENKQVLVAHYYTSIVSDAQPKITNEVSGYQTTKFTEINFDVLFDADNQVALKILQSKYLNKEL